MLFRARSDRNAPLPMLVPRSGLGGTGRGEPFPGHFVRDFPNEGLTIPSLALAGVARYRPQLRNAFGSLVK